LFQNDDGRKAATFSSLDYNVSFVDFSVDDAEGIAAGSFSFILCSVTLGGFCEYSLCILSSRFKVYGDPCAPCERLTRIQGF
jgi:hypothetical protein